GAPARRPGRSRHARGRRSRRLHRRRGRGAPGRAGGGEPRGLPGPRHAPGARSHRRERAPRGGHERAVRAEPRRPRRGGGRSMSLRSTARALPTLFRVGFAEMVAYRAEMLVWVLATTMPLIMLALWSAVAHDAPVGRFDQQDFIAYFLATFIVRQLTGAWVAWQLSFEVRTGTLAMRLLRPLHPMVSYARQNLSAIPLRLIVALPVAVIALVLTGFERLPGDPLLWGVFLISLVGGWLITFLANAAIGTLALWTGSSVKLMDVWLPPFIAFTPHLLPL